MRVDSWAFRQSASPPRSPTCSHSCPPSRPLLPLNLLLVRRRATRVPLLAEELDPRRRDHVRAFLVLEELVKELLSLLDAKHWLRHRYSWAA